MQFYDYMIVIRSPVRSVNQGGKLFEIGEYGEGKVSIYNDLDEIHSNKLKHVGYIGEFQLSQKENKTANELMEEIREGIEKIVSDNRRMRIVIE